jgi:O-antigen ligase
VGGLAWLAVLATLAVAVPTLLAWNVAPSTTFLNQALAVAGWGGFVVALAGPIGQSGARAARAGGIVRATWPGLLALALIAAAALGSSVLGSLPASLMLSALVLLAAAAVALLGGAAAPAQAFTALCIGLALAAVPNVGIALVQVFAPHGADGDWIARSALPGRAVGNLRQPNHVASLLLWSAIALVALAELGRLRRPWALAGLALVMWAVVLTASRTGMVGAMLLGLWALVDRRLTRAGRGLLLSAPAWYALAWAGMAWWARQAQQAFGGTARLAESVESSSRVGIWRDTLVLIREQPWAGVGFGEFNFAWSLTPLPQRPVAFFDHTHNLPLQLAVELGLPLAALVLGLLAYALVRGVQRCAGPRAPAGEAGTTRRAALAMVVMIGLHSLLEYPLWYAYFLLPAAWCLGVALAPRLGPGPSAAAPVPDAPDAPDAPEVPEVPEVPEGREAPMPGHASRPARAGLRAAGALLVVGALASVADFARVVPIFESGAGAPPLAQRIAAGQRSVLFAHHAHYAAATVSATPAAEMASLQQAAHHLLDTRLMMAWARAHADAGDLERARHLAARLREFRNPASSDFFEACAASAPAAQGPAGREAALADQPEPFQCESPSRALGWRDFVAR